MKHTLTLVATLLALHTPPTQATEPLPWRGISLSSFNEQGHFEGRQSELLSFR